MDNELMEVIRYLRHKSSVSIQDIAHNLKISRRQVLYRLEKLNVLLKQENQPQIVFGAFSNNLVLLDGALQEGLRQVRDSMLAGDTYYMNRPERKNYLCFLFFILPEKVILSDMQEWLQVSRTTVVSDLKELQAELMEKGIYLSHNREKGYFMEGPELEIRREMMRRIGMVLAEDKNVKVLDMFLADQGLPAFKEVRKVLATLSPEHGLRFVEERFSEFIYICILLLERISRLETELAATAHMEDFKEYRFIQDLEQAMELTLPPYERNYLTAWILGISFGNIHEETSDCLHIARLTGAIMERFEYMTGAHYKNTEDIFVQLYAHLRPAYYRILYRLPILNPLKDKVKNEYRDLYRLVEASLEPLKKDTQAQIQEDEIAYFVIHFAVIYAGKQKEQEVRRQRALVICQSGPGSMSILMQDLQDMFPELEFERPTSTLPDNLDVDLVFSTDSIHHLPHLPVPVVRVSPVMDLQERYHVMREVWQATGNTYSSRPSVQAVVDIVHQYCDVPEDGPLYAALTAYFASLELPKKPQVPIRLETIIKEDYIQLKAKAKSWEEAIETACQPLVEAGAITEGYVRDTISSVKYMGPYLVITKHLALAHTRIEAGALDYALGITVLEEPVEFGAGENDPVKYVLALSTLDNQRHLSAMADLLKLLEDDGFYACLDNAEEPKEVLAYINAKIGVS